MTMSWPTTANRTLFGRQSKQEAEQEARGVSPSVANHIQRAATARNNRIPCCRSKKLLCATFVTFVTVYASIQFLADARLLLTTTRTTSVSVTTNEAMIRQREIGQQPVDWDPRNITDPWKVELFQRLDRIRAACGELCQINSLQELDRHKVNVPGSDLPMVVVESFNCPLLLGLEELDAGDTTFPAIPTELEGYFSLGGAYGVSRHAKRRKEAYLGGDSEKRLWSTGNVWKEADVQALIRDVAAGTAKGSYGAASIQQIRDVLQQVDMRGKSVLVIGSSNPWLEAVALLHGARKVTTLEYGRIVSEHPQIETLTPDQFRIKYAAGQLEHFDGVLSHSSIEHSGLGRYGDALNPWGDLLTVARAWCVTVEGGFLYLGLPTGKDIVYSNWHRIYGRIRWPLVTANWKPVNLTGGPELDLGIWKSQINGGYGYLFQK